VCVCVRERVCAHVYKRANECVRVHMCVRERVSVYTCIVSLYALRGMKAIQMHV